MLKFEFLGKEPTPMHFTSGNSRGLYWIHIFDGEQQVTWHYEEKDMGAWVMCKTALKVAMEER